MTPISRGFGGRRRDDVDPSRIPPGQYRGQAPGCSFEQHKRHSRVAPGAPGDRKCRSQAIAEPRNRLRLKSRTCREEDGAQRFGLARRVKRTEAVGEYLRGDGHAADSWVDVGQRSGQGAEFFGALAHGRQVHWRLWSSSSRKRGLVTAAHGVAQGGCEGGAPREPGELRGSQREARVGRRAAPLREQPVEPASAYQDPQPQEHRYGTAADDVTGGSGIENGHPRTTLRLTAGDSLEGDWDCAMRGSNADCLLAAGRSERQPSCTPSRGPPWRSGSGLRRSPR
jgi:hypothetical protein